MDQLPKELIFEIASYFKWEDIYKLTDDCVYWIELYNRTFKDRKRTLEVVVTAIRHEDTNVVELLLNNGWSFLSPAEIMSLAISTKKSKVIEYLLDNHRIYWTPVRRRANIQKMLQLPTDLVLDLLENEQLSRSKKVIHELIRMVIAQDQGAIELYRRIQEDNPFGDRWISSFNRIWDAESWTTPPELTYFERRFHSFYRIQHYHQKLKDPQFVDSQIVDNPTEMFDIYDWTMRVNRRYIGNRKILLETAIEHCRSVDELCDIYQFDADFTEEELVSVTNKYRYDKCRDLEIALDVDLHRYLLGFDSYRNHPSLLLYRYRYKMFDRSREVADIWQFIEATIGDLGYLPRIGYQVLLETLHQIGRKQDARRLTYYQVDVR